MISLDYLQLDLFVVSGALLLLCSLYYVNKRNARLPLPPGPKPLPIIGNLLDLPKDKSHETYALWAKQYGDVVHIRTLGSSMIILNSFKAVYDLLERRSSIYSSRPHLTMLHELMDFGGVTVFQPYGGTWRKHRAMYQKHMNQVSVREFQPSQAAAAKGLLRLFLDSPQNYQEHIRHVVMGIAYGQAVSPTNDPYVALAERNANAFTKAMRPGAFLVDLIPMLKHVPAWMPGAGFQKFGKETQKSIRQQRDVPFRDVARRLTAGTAPPSFVANALSELGTTDESNENVDVVKRVAGGIFGAGSDTTTATFHWFILSMVLYPEIQKKAQAELDNVVGQDRLPQFSDRPHLPYLGAIVNEVLRSYPVVPTAFPHVTTQEDVYEGYRIPANSLVFGNAWSILRDPKIYPDPLTFRPERFLPDEKGNVARDPAAAGSFGFGRRICAGRHLADASVWIFAASVLSTFNLSNAVDEHGHEIDVRYALEPRHGSFSHPQPFRCSIKPRSEEIEEILRGLEQS